MPSGAVLPFELPRRARRVGTVLRAFENASVVSRTYRYPGSVFTLIREPTREEMAAPPRADRLPTSSSRVLSRRVVSERSDTSPIAVTVQERDGSRYVALVHEIRPRDGDWHARRSVALAGDELGEAARALCGLEGTV